MGTARAVAVDYAHDLGCFKQYQDVIVRYRERCPE